jgi:hypothetical protein
MDPEIEELARAWHRANAADDEVEASALLLELGAAIRERDGPSVTPMLARLSAVLPATCPPPSPPCRAGPPARGRPPAGRRLLVLAGRFERTGDIQTVRQLWSSFEAALQWLDRYGAIATGTALSVSNQRGLSNQG